MSNQIAFCPKCRQDMNYSVKENTESTEFKEEVYEFTVRKAFCEKCGSELHVAELEEANLKALHDAYPQRHDIILALIQEWRKKRTKRVSLRA